MTDTEVIDSDGESISLSEEEIIPFLHNIQHPVTIKLRWDFRKRKK